jgi:ribosomal protein S27E
MLGFRGPAPPSPVIGDALNAGYGYLEVKCLGCDNHQTVALDIVRRPKTTPVHELERYMRCKDCSAVRRYAFKRSQLVALRPNKITADSPASTVWPGDRD